jgi:hypothetical protein
MVYIARQFDTGSPCELEIYASHSDFAAHNQRNLLLLQSERFICTEELGHGISPGHLEGTEIMWSLPIFGL